MWFTIIAGTLLVTGIILLGIFAKDDDEDEYYGGFDDGAAIQQYREWKSKASSYAEMEEWNDAIDQARERLRNRGTW